jgi:hypothetical protein
MAVTGARPRLVSWTRESGFGSPRAARRGQEYRACRCLPVARSQIGLAPHVCDLLGPQVTPAAVAAPAPKLLASAGGKSKHPVPTKRQSLATRRDARSGLIAAVRDRLATLLLPRRTSYLTGPVLSARDYCFGFPAGGSSSPRLGSAAATNQDARPRQAAAGGVRAAVTDGSTTSIEMVVINPLQHSVRKPDATLVEHDQQRTRTRTRG